ncbi:hypothetical protein [Pseudomonas sp. CGJS7]|uniref:hypothetical protein n=1 Tax=Pseudomonas sp. CGJS7 TaxID=3109348 RepID=UPI00300B5C20
MPHTITSSLALARTAPKSVAFLGLRAVWLTLLLLISQGAWAEPAAADRALGAAKQEYRVLKLQHSIGKQHVQTGQWGAATSSFLAARISAIKMSNQLSQLYQENVDSFQRGLYRDGVSQQKAIDHTRVAGNNSKVLEVRLQMLSQQPSLQQNQIAVEVELVKLDHSMLLLEQAMIAAQQ